MLFSLACVICLHLVWMSNSFISPLESTLSGATTSGENGPDSDVNKGVLRIPQSSRFTGALPPACLMSYPGQLLEKSYSSAEMQWV